uniref:Uncharacterized protein n=1 Tax=Laticauda laticaudata TaxID=8630 RepID=A0A8C5SJV0_LATLA
MHPLLLLRLRFAVLPRKPCGYVICFHRWLSYEHRFTSPLHPPTSFLCCHLCLCKFGALLESGINNGWKICSSAVSFLHTLYSFTLQQSVNLEELKDWELKNIVKMSGRAGKVVPSSMANLPLRFDRNFLERRNIKPTVNLPLRFGRAFRYFSHSFEKTPSVQGFFHSLANLPEKFGRSFLFMLYSIRFEEGV